jgi:hypothetical protein
MQAQIGFDLKEGIYADLHMKLPILGLIIQLADNQDFGCICL